jgi:RimJ/RimL family protein N-acetyltransferase
MLPKPSAVVFVANVPRMTRFYQELASMMVVHGDKGYTVLEVEGFQLVIHALRGEPEVFPVAAGQVPVREDSYIKVCLPVASIAAARDTAQALGRLIKPATAEWESPSRRFRACDGHDPEGNVLQVRENAKKPPTMPEMPTLLTPRLELRPFRIADGPTVERLAGDRAVADTTLNIPHPYPEGAAEQWIATHADDWSRGERLTLAICSRNTAEELIGAISLHISVEHSNGEIGYWLSVDNWGKGYTTEAARALVDYAFTTLRLHRVVGRHLTRNVTSGRVMQKVGMQLEGINRDAFVKWSKFEDVAMYSILDSEWRTRSP